MEAQRHGERLFNFDFRISIRFESKAMTTSRNGTGLKVEIRNPKLRLLREYAGKEGTFLGSCVGSRMRAGEFAKRMKNILEVLNKKEDELQRLQSEVEALRIAARLLADDMETAVMDWAWRSAGQSRQLPQVRPAAAGFPKLEVKAPGAHANGGATLGHASNRSPTDGPVHSAEDGMYSAAWGNASREFP
jgi:hypothetical protein